MLTGHIHASRGEYEGQKFYVECARCSSEVEMAIHMWPRISSVGSILDYRVEDVSFSCHNCTSKDVVFRELGDDVNRYKVEFKFYENGYRAIAYPFI